MNTTSPKREQWTEADVLALPPGEHDYFDRKSGHVQDSTDRFLGTVAKAACAFANSGGGHLVLGVDDTGRVDGLNPLVGKTSTREWLEQKIPTLLQYALTDFRVHEVMPDASATIIPPGRVVVVVDVGDSALAPHQSAYGGGGAQKHIYYMRSGSHSVPAPHFYLELLRQRLTNPTLEVVSTELVHRNTAREAGRVFVALAVVARVENTGRIAAYKWGALAKRVSRGDEDADDWSSYVFTQADAPASWHSGGIPIDTTLLPGASTTTDLLGFGVWLTHPEEETAIAQQLKKLLGDLVVHYQIATETSLSEMQTTPIAGDVDALADEIARKL